MVVALSPSISATGFSKEVLPYSTFGELGERGLSSAVWRPRDISRQERRKLRPCLDFFF